MIPVRFCTFLSLYVYGWRWRWRLRCDFSSRKRRTPALWEESWSTLSVQQLWGTTAKCCSQQFASAQRCLWTPFHSSGERAEERSAQKFKQSPWSPPPASFTPGVAHEWRIISSLKKNSMWIRGNALQTRVTPAESGTLPKQQAFWFRRKCKALDFGEVVLVTGNCPVTVRKENNHFGLAVDPKHLSLGAHRGASLS